MKKLVIKTTLITLASIIGALIITVSALCLFAPATMAGFFDDVGNYSASVFFYEKQYEKSGDINDLDKLLLKVYAKGDTCKVEEYSKKIIHHEDFGGYSVDKKEYYYDCYVLSLAQNGKFDEAVGQGLGFINQYGYTPYNPLRMLLKEHLNDQMVEQKAKLKQAIESVTTFHTLTDYEQIIWQQDLLELN